jgi:hypothetical protein
MKIALTPGPSPRGRGELILPLYEGGKVRMGVRAMIYC